MFARAQRFQKHRRRSRPLLGGLLVFALVLLEGSVDPRSAQATRIEDLCDIRGVRPNQLIGYGLVVGLNRTGDMGQSRFTVQSTAAMLRRLGANVDPRAIQTRNAAAVMVTATISAFSNPGTRVDVVVSSLGNARSLQGGTLLQTPLYGGDRRIYAVAQGALVLGGFAVSGRTGSNVGQNHVTAGRVPGGAILERPIPMPGLQGNSLFLSLRDPNFVTAQRIAQAINSKLGAKTASALDSGSIKVAVPSTFRGNAVGLIAEVQQLEVEPDALAKVVVDERTGTVVLGANVRVSEVAVAQGGLTVEVSENFGVSQPQPFGNGQTAVVPQTEINAKTQPGAMQYIKGSSSLKDVVTALNALGAKPRDLIVILQALKTAGALQAQVEVH